MSRRQTTLAEVAKHADVSLATASRVLNGSNRQVRDALRDRVLTSARTLGYLPNASAQALARNSSTLVGLVVHDIADPYFSSIAAGVIEVTERAGFGVVLGTTARDPQREVELLSMLRAHRARAVVLAGSRSTDPAMTRRLAAEITAFAEQGGRVSCVSQAQLGVDTVVPTNEVGATALAGGLLELGHRRFAVLAGPKELVSATDRVRGFQAGLAEAGVELPPTAIVHGAFTRDGGYEATKRLLAGRKRKLPTCIFAVTDVMAIGAMTALREEGLSVPGDVSVAGFDDIPTLRDLVPALSTVRLPLVEMGAKAADLALGPPGRLTMRPREIPMASQVVLRESTAPPAGPGLG